MKRSRERMLISACKMVFLFFNIPLIMVICRPIPTAIVIFYFNSKENKKQMWTNSSIRNLGSSYFPKGIGSP
jgi:hypothetical protein